MVKSLNSSEEEARREETTSSPPRFDNWQFEHYFGSRKAGTIVNNALPSEFFRRDRKEVTAIEATFAKLREKFEKKVK